MNNNHRNHKEPMSSLLFEAAKDVLKQNVLSRFGSQNHSNAGHNSTKEPIPEYDLFGESTQNNHDSQRCAPESGYDLFGKPQRGQSHTIQYDKLSLDIFAEHYYNVVNKSKDVRASQLHLYRQNTANGGLLYRVVQTFMDNNGSIISESNAVGHPVEMCSQKIDEQLLQHFERSNPIIL